MWEGVEVSKRRAEGCVKVTGWQRDQCRDRRSVPRGQARLTQKEQHCQDETQVHALDGKCGPILESCTKRESKKYTVDSWSKDLKWSVLEKRSGKNQHYRSCTRRLKWTTRDLSFNSHNLEQEKRGSGKSRRAEAGNKRQSSGQCATSPHDSSSRGKGQV